MSNPDAIIRQIESFLAQEQRLLNQLEQIKVQQKDPSKEMKKEFVNILARSTLGRSGGKIVRNIVNQGDKQRFDTLRAQVDSQHINLVRNILAFINTHIKDKKILIHCNQGYSRTPSIALLWLAKRTDIVSNEGYQKASSEVRILYPNYQPGRGIAQYLFINWNNID